MSGIKEGLRRWNPKNRFMAFRDSSPEEKRRSVKEFFVNNLLYTKYTQELDRESAYELLTQKVAAEVEAEAEAKAEDEKVEENNKRFVIQIIPKISKPQAIIE